MSRTGARATALAALLAGLLACGGAEAAAGSAATAAAPAAASYQLGFLLRSQSADGGFPLQAGQPPSVMPSAWAALALAAARNAGILPAATDGTGAVAGYLERTVRSELGAGAIERTVLALRALGRPVDEVDGVPLLADLQRLIRRDGSVAGQTNLTSWAIIALHAAGAPVPAASVAWLERQQDGDGGFNFDGGGRTVPSDPDDTGAALQALAAAGAGAGSSVTVRRAIAYLRRDQNRDGGFGSPLGAVSNTQSTAWALQGLTAVGVAAAGFHRPGGPTPLFYLRAMTRSSGLVDYQAGVAQTPVWVTASVLPALLAQPYPIAAPQAPASVHVTRHRTAAAHRAPRPRRHAPHPHSRTVDVPASIGRLMSSLHSLL